MYDIVVIGGGASGICSAIHASKEFKNCKIAIVEKKKRIAKKLLTTGNGRCNISNLDLSFENYYTSSDMNFIKNIISEFDFCKTKEFFESLGIVFTNEENKVFPNSFQASSVVDMLRFSLEEAKIEEICEFNCVDLNKDKFFTIISDDGRKIQSKTVVFAVGGSASPQLGTDGRSYDILKKFGHRMTPVFPSLVQIVCDSKKCTPLKGVKFNGKISVYVDEEKSAEEYGEILFTEYGLSGPPVFLISRIVSEGLYYKKNINVKLDLMPEYSVDDVKNLLNSRNKKLTLDIFLNGMLNKIIGREIVKSVCGHKLNNCADILSKQEIDNLAMAIKEWDFPVFGTKGWENAQVTAGGIKLDGFNCKTLESLFCEGLFACGEVLDVDGKCGGYNLQWAWSSGAVAGINVGKRAKEVF